MNNILVCKSWNYSTLVNIYFATPLSELSRHFTFQISILDFKVSNLLKNKIIFLKKKFIVKKFQFNSMLSLF